MVGASSSEGFIDDQYRRRFHVQDATKYAYEAVADMYIHTNMPGRERFLERIKTGQVFYDGQKYRIHSLSEDQAELLTAKVEALRAQQRVKQQEQQLRAKALRNLHAEPL